MLDHPGNKSNAFDMHITEPLLEFCNNLTIPVSIITHQENSCLGNMANVLHLIGDTECEDFFGMNIDKDWSWFHQKLLKGNSRQFCKKTNLFYIIQTVLIHHFG